MREVVPIRLGDGEREQLAKAAGLQGMPVSTYVRCAALQASAVAVGKASIAPRPAPKPKPVVVLDVAPKREHYVDGELVRR